MARFTVQYGVLQAVVLGGKMITRERFDIKILLRVLFEFHNYITKWEIWRLRAERWVPARARGLHQSLSAVIG